jgi:hypothetical protein
MSNCDPIGDFLSSLPQRLMAARRRYLSTEAISVRFWNEAVEPLGDTCLIG